MCGVASLRYCGMIALLEETIANLTCAIEERGWWNGTVFVFASDNGAMDCNEVLPPSHVSIIFR